MTAFVVFAFALGGSVLGRLVGTRLPSDHLSDSTRNIVSLGTGFVATMAALVIGLTVSAAKDTFDERREQLDQACIQLIVIDRAMAEYGDDSAPVRAALKTMAEDWLKRFWNVSHAGKAIDPMADEESAQAAAGRRKIERKAGEIPPIEIVEREIRALKPGNPSQEEIRTNALDHMNTLVELRWTRFEEYGEGRVPSAFVCVIAIWLALIFFSFGLFAPKNVTASAVFLICAVSSAIAMMLAVEMEEPFTGLIRLSHLPLHETITHLER